ncbi:hypothetical protein FQA39_LY16525 [Lamprigera yunnana]|nr:hypothetical protein FQA39_LY16525 [Lamprigera yunnana]
MYKASLAYATKKVNSMISNGDFQDPTSNFIIELPDGDSFELTTKQSDNPNQPLQVLSKEDQRALYEKIGAHILKINKNIKFDVWIGYVFSGDLFLPVHSKWKIIKVFRSEIILFHHSLLEETFNDYALSIPWKIFFVKYKCTST